MKSPYRISGTGFFLFEDLPFPASNSIDIKTIFMGKIMKRWSVVSAAAGLLMTFSLAKARSVSFPPELQSYVHDGHFEVGDFAWMRGAFPGANDEQEKRWEHLQAYSTACLKEATKQETEALLREGEKVSVSLEERPYIPYADEKCSALWFWSSPPQNVKTWPEFKTLVTEGSPVIRAYLTAVEETQKAENLIDVDGKEHEFERLLIRGVTDQTIRRPLMNGLDLTGEGHPASAQVNEFRTMFLAERMEEIDHANTRWLQQIVASKGWPTLTQAGSVTSKVAWLLVQHADDDIAFQAKALKLMTQLAKKGEVNQSNYALLTDRVSIALTGHQIYGSQMSCIKGRLIPLPIKQPTDVNQRRHALGIGTIEQKISEMKEAGICR